MTKQGNGTWILILSGARFQPNVPRGLNEMAGPTGATIAFERNGVLWAARKFGLIESKTGEEFV